MDALALLVLLYGLFNSLILYLKSLFKLFILLYYLKKFKLRDIIYIIKFYKL
jgi:hypothetical protein